MAILDLSLSEAIWQFFSRNDGKRDGDTFEELVEIILNRRIGVPWLDGILESWERTPGSHDQSRDFILRRLDGEAWAECKNYKKSPSRHIVSATLAMATVKRVRTILLFSPEPFNRPALAFFSSFQEVNDINIHAYHGDTLLWLVADNAELIQARFPEVSGLLQRERARLPTPQKINVVVRVSKDIDDDERLGRNPEPLGAGGVSFLPQGRCVEIYQGQLVALDVYITNHDPLNDMIGKLEIIMPERSTLTLLSSAQGAAAHGSRVDVKRASFKWVRYLLRASAGRVNGQLPKITFTADTAYESATSDTLVVTQRMAAVFVGGERGAMKRAAAILSGARNRTVFLVVHGKSGVGKTRQLQEMREPFITTGRLVHTIDCEEAGIRSFRHFARLIFRKITPGYVQEHPQTLCEVSVPNSQLAVGRPQRLAELLDAEDGEEPDIEEMADLFEAVLSVVRRPRAFMIDNLQSLPQAGINFLRALDERDIRSAVAPLFAVTVNEEQAGQGSASRAFLNDMLTRGVVWSDRSGETPRYVTFPLTDFTAGEIEWFINDHFAVKHGKPFSMRYPNLMRELTRDVVKRPLFIEQFLNYLSDIDAIEWDGETGLMTVLHEERLQEAIQRAYIGTSLEQLLTKRWTLISAGMKPGERANFRLFALLGSIDLDHLRDFGIPSGQKTDWVLRGLARVDDGRLSFYHGQLRRFFFDLFQFSESDIKENATCFRRVVTRSDAAGLTAHYPLAYFTAKASLKPLALNDRRSVVPQVRNDGPDHGLALFLRRVFKSTLAALQAGPILGEDIDLLRWTAERTRHDVRYDVGIAQYDKGRERLSALIGRCDDSAARAAFVCFAIANANSYFTGHRDREALLGLDEAQYHVRQHPQTFPNSLLSHLADRRCVALKSLNRLPEAGRAGREALRLAKRSDDAERAARLVFAYIDIGNIFQNGHALIPSTTFTRAGKSRVRNALYYWAKAREIFLQNPKSAAYDADTGPMVELYHIQSRLLVRDLDGLADLMDEQIRECRRRNRAFFGVKHLLLKCIASLQHPTLFSAGSPPVDLALETVQWAIGHDVRRYIWMARYMEAKVLLASGQYDNARKSFLAAAKALHGVATHQGIEEYHYHFYDDLVLAARTFGWNILGDTLDLLRSPMLRQRIRNVFDLDEPGFARLTASYKGTARFCVGDDSPYPSLRNRNLPYP
ncbi:hypothetical protein ABAZ39_11815 [Azospirillum argentinense]|uniref:Restriction endonuclease n=1 Tax=Azospirillum argentinense TaxID=2970906 RepID=A0A060DIR1_9PROT|nr:AAA family ATPase [Azospirillum argentinense]AIB12665.1 hypothetical protein ABAZ39_11815 [Azospirillum argentinense]EZQ09862.1 hypothetical protein ABAZ39_13235 [Azospirillum argentinense]